jgi:hypothetical protein
MTKDYIMDAPASLFEGMQREISCDDNPPAQWNDARSSASLNAGGLKAALCIVLGTVALLLLWVVMRPDVVCDQRSALHWMQCK